MENRLHLRWYGERGIVNAILFRLHRDVDPLAAVRRLLSAVRWSDGSTPDWIESVDSVSAFVEWGWADFGNPDLLLVLHTSNGTRCVLVEAKIVPYVLSMRPNQTGMREGGFNSSINGQLSLKYRFAKAVERATPEMPLIEESVALLNQYRGKLNDPRNTPRRLAKTQVVGEVVLANRLLGIAEERWSYIALTWDADDRAFFMDPMVKELDGLPCFLSESGADIIESMRGRLGWLGFQHLENALDLRNDAAYLTAFNTMQETTQPDEKDYQVADANVRGAASPESVALAAKLRHELFQGFDIVEYTGSYSVKRGGQTVAKVIPRVSSVFVGVRETETPRRWFSGPLETVSIQGVSFVGVSVPVDKPDSADAVILARGLDQRS